MAMTDGELLTLMTFNGLSRCWPCITTAVRPSGQWAYVLCARVEVATADNALSRCTHQPSARSPRAGSLKEADAGSLCVFLLKKHMKSDLSIFR